VRAVVESAGIHDVLSKSLGPSNPHNLVHATVAALRGLKSPESVAGKRSMQLDSLDYQRRGSTNTAGRRRASVAPPPGKPGGGGAPSGGGEGGSQ